MGEQIPQTALPGPRGWGHHHHPRPTGAAAPYMSRTKSFTRRSRALPESLARTMATHGADYVIEPRRGQGWTTVAEGFRVDLAREFGRSAPVALEIGSGTGEQIVAAARRWPDRDFLALEVWEPGIAKTVSKAVAAGVGNLRMLEADAAQALPVILPDACLDEVWTFFPDPWRKARHHKRRLVSDAFARQVARVLADGGAWRLATDWDDYAWQMRDVVEACPDLANPYLGERPDPQDREPGRGGFAPRWAGRVSTHFEERGRAAGRRAHDVIGIRLPRQGHAGQEER
jgi:tRNA (guanine-N7-)-methyltransferase